MSDRHPVTVFVLEQSRALIRAADEMLDRVNRIRVRLPSPSGRVIPEVDGLGRLTDIYIAPGTIATSPSTRDLADDIMAAIRESTADAARQHQAVLRDTTWPDIPDMPEVRRRRL
ncbi:YbaB/EbfC family nucleoid-associated protein [Nocardia rhamnosiphila]|uniref:YbaB/EbfC family nucleoid-associated protein n=1 Tax=Nocardia rhamnosiphila TaxID=426716 RepID=UPI0037899864